VFFARFLPEANFAGKYRQKHGFLVTNQIWTRNIGDKSRFDLGKITVGKNI